jgi:hypothetical protein
VHIAVDETIWDFDTWAAAERPLFMAMVEERISRYGSISTAENHALWPQMKAEVGVLSQLAGEIRPDSP